MKLIGHLKEQVDRAESRDEARGMIEKAGMLLTDEELDSVSGGTLLYRQYYYYTVGEGENLIEIARMLHLTKEQIMGWNDIHDPHSIYEGQKLKIYK